MDEISELVDYTTSKESAEQLWDTTYEQVLLLAHSRAVQDQPSRELILEALKEDPTGIRRVPNTSTFFQGKSSEIKARLNHKNEALLLKIAQQSFYNMM